MQSALLIFGYDSTYNWLDPLQREDPVLLFCHSGPCKNKHLKHFGLSRSHLKWRKQLTYPKVCIPQHYRVVLFGSTLITLCYHHGIPSARSISPGAHPSGKEHIFFNATKPWWHIGYWPCKIVRLEWHDPTPPLSSDISSQDFSRSNLTQSPC